MTKHNARKTWFTADTHLGHSGLIEHGYRPAFKSIEEMENTIVTNWNELVGPRDTVWILGDFTLAGAAEAERLLTRLNGARLHLIWGNHDRNSVRRLARWASSSYATEINLDGRHIVLCHYAMRVWNGWGRGTIMLYGHSHGGLPGCRQSTDVGVDSWDFRPVSIEQIEARLATQPVRVPEDHHGHNAERLEIP
jgi:calcineurin-like phosphoesterase family protein